LRNYMMIYFLFFLGIVVLPTLIVNNTTKVRSKTKINYRTQLESAQCWIAQPTFLTTWTVNISCQSNATIEAHHQNRWNVMQKMQSQNLSQQHSCL